MEIPSKGVVRIYSENFSNIKQHSKSAFLEKVLTTSENCLPSPLDVGGIFVESKHCAAFSAKKGSLKGNIRIYLLKNNVNTLLYGHSSTVIDLAFAPQRPSNNDTTILASLSVDGVCKIWEIDNQESDGEVDVRELINLRVKNKLVQRIAFHPASFSQGSQLLCILHGTHVSGILINKDFRENVVIDPTSSIIEESTGIMRLHHSSLVLDISFYRSSKNHYKCITAQENGQVCLWDLKLLEEEDFAADDDEDLLSTSSLDALHSGLNLSPLISIQVSQTPVLNCAFVNSDVIICRAVEDCEISLWSLNDYSRPIQQIKISSDLIFGKEDEHNFRKSTINQIKASFVQRSFDNASCFVLFLKKTGVLFFQLPNGKTVEHAMLIEETRQLISLTARYDDIRDRVVFHCVDTQVVCELELPAYLAFHATAISDLSKGSFSSKGLFFDIKKGVSNGDGLSLQRTFSSLLFRKKGVS